MKITTRELQSDDWPVIEELFGKARGVRRLLVHGRRSEERGRSYRAQLGEPIACRFATS